MDLDEYLPSVAPLSSGSNRDKKSVLHQTSKSEQCGTIWKVAVEILVLVLI